MKALLLKGPGEAVLTELEKLSIGSEDVLIRGPDIFPSQNPR